MVWPDAVIEVFEQLLGCGEGIWLFLVADMPVVALPGLVIVSQYADTMIDQGKSVLIAVVTPWQLPGQAPENPLLESTVGETDRLLEELIHLHVTEMSDAIDRWQ